MADVSTQIEAGAMHHIPENKRPATIKPEVASKLKKIEAWIKKKRGREAAGEAFTPTDKKEPLGFDSQVALEKKTEGNAPEAPGSGFTAGGERQVYEHAEEAIWVSQRLTEVGFAQLEPAEQNFLRAEVEKRLTSFEGFNSITDKALRDMIVDKMLGDKKFQIKLRDDLKAAFTEEDADRKMKTANDAFDAAKKAVEGNDTALSETQKKLNGFKASEPNGQRLNDLELNLDPIYINKSAEDLFKSGTGLKNISRAEFNTIQQRVEQKMKTVPPTPITDSDEQIMEGILTGKADAAELLRLQNERKELEERKKELDDKKKQLEEARDQKTTERESVIAGKAERDNAFIQKMSNLINEATDAYVKEDNVEFNEAWDAVTLEEENAATDRDGKVLAGIPKRWSTDEYSGGKIKTKRNVKQINADLEYIAGDSTRGVNKGQGLEKFIKARLKEGVSDPVELARIDERMKDPEFVKEQKGKIAVELVRAKILSGGKLTNEQGSRLLNDPDVADAMRVELVRKAHEIEAKTGKTGLAAGVDKLVRAQSEHGLLYAMAVLLGGPMLFVGKQVVH